MVKGGEPFAQFAVLGGGVLGRVITIVCPLIVDPKTSDHNNKSAMFRVFTDAGLDFFVDCYFHRKLNQKTK